MIWTTFLEVLGQFALVLLGVNVFSLLMILTGFFLITLVDTRRDNKEKKLERAKATILIDQF